MALRRPALFKLTTEVAPESDLQETVAGALDRLLMPPAVWAAYPAGHIPLPAQWAVKLIRMGLKRSWPDILVLHQVLYGIELKKPGEGLSIARWVRTRSGGSRYVEGQREVFPRLEGAGMKLAVCTSLPEVLDQLEAWGVPLRGRIAA